MSTLCHFEQMLSSPWLPQSTTANPQAHKCLSSQMSRHWHQWKPVWCMASPNATRTQTAKDTQAHMATKHTHIDLLEVMYSALTHTDAHTFPHTRYPGLIIFFPVACQRRKSLAGLSVPLSFISCCPGQQPGLLVRWQRSWLELVSW